MGPRPDLADASWRLKLDRAKEHLDEMEGHIWRYADRHAYEAFIREHPQGEEGEFQVVLRITEQPTKTLAVIVGDAVHNLRSSLDHLAVSLVPRARSRKAAFPIQQKDLWAKDAQGVFLIKDNEARKSFERAVRGMSPEALAGIHALQPYQLRDNAPQHFLAILSGLDNDDKHRKLIPKVSGLRDASVMFWDGSDGLGQGTFPLFDEDGAQIMHFGRGRGYKPDPAKVRVDIYGRPAVAVKVGRPKRNVEASVVLAQVLDYIRGTVLPTLEPFARA